MKFFRKPEIKPKTEESLALQFGSEPIPLFINIIIFTDFERICSNNLVRQFTLNSKLNFKVKNFI